MGGLTVKGIAALSAPGMYADGSGSLYLRIGPSGSKSWIVRPIVHGKRREMGLGPIDLVGLAEARDMASAVRKRAKEGGDPIAERQAERAEAAAALTRNLMTFEEAARRVHASLLPTWRSEKHGFVWWHSLRDHVFPTFGAKPIHTVGRPDVLKVLEKVHTAKPETAKRLRQRMSQILDWARHAGHYPHENPLAGIKAALPKVESRTKHMPAMPWGELPSFMERLAEREGVSARCLELLILTAVRSGEARGALWSEIDLEAKVWEIPAARMKKNRGHRVPLTQPAIKVLEAVKGLDSVLIFPSPHRGKDGSGKPLSDAAFAAIMDRMGVINATTHGYRTSFRVWADESAHADRAVSETCLSHVVGDQTERAYARSDLFARRAVLMESWGRFVTGGIGNVVELVRA